MQMMSGDGFSINMPSAIDGFAQEHQLNANPSVLKPNPPNPVAKKKRNLPGTPGKQPTAISFIILYFNFQLMLFILRRAQKPR